MYGLDLEQPEPGCSYRSKDPAVVFFISVISSLILGVYRGQQIDARHS
jgi:hypothetical protein